MPTVPDQQGDRISDNGPGGATSDEVCCGGERQEEKRMKTRVEQEWANRLKVIRNAVRLKYSLMADDELNQILDEQKKLYMKSVMKGELPEPLDIKKLIDGK